jgi:perosamine synthetase
MIKLIKPYITFEEVEAEFREVFDSGWFTKGKNVNRFKAGLAEYTGAKASFLTTSATTALWMCLKVLNIGPGDEVIVSDFSFPASANVVEDLGAVPVFADVDPDTFNMLPAELEKKITDRTKAVMFVDALGNPSGISSIKEICQAKSIPLIEDAACAIGSSENGTKCGNIADFTCFSFHPRKLLTTGEGGAITCNGKWAEKLEIKLNHGASIRNGVHDFVDYGYNFRMSELQAVLGIKQLEKLDNIVDERNEIRSRFTALLEPLGFRAQKVADNVRYNVQSLVFITPEGINRDQLVSQLADNGIESTLGTYSLSATSYYRKKYNDVQPNAEALQNTTITLPCYSGVNVDYICSQIKALTKSEI